MGHAISGQWDARELEKKQKELYSSDVSLEPVIFKEQKSMYHSEASPRIIHPQDEKRGEKRLIASDEIFGEKRIYPVGHMPQEDEGGFFQRWHEYRKMVREQYPFVRRKSLRKLPQIPLNYIAYKICDYISTQIGPRDNLGKVIAGGAVDGYGYTFEQMYKMLPFEIFPRIRTFTVFSNSYTETYKMYTIEKGGWELPIYFQCYTRDGVEGPPTTERIETAAKFVDEYSVSPYNKIRQVENFIDEDFIKYGIDKYSRGDFKRYFQEEPHRFRRWLMRDDTWMIYQYGNRDTTMEASIDASLTDPSLVGRIKVYDDTGKTSGFWYNLGRLMGDESPSSWTALLYWQLGDWIYDGVDLVFGPAEATFNKLGFPKPAIRRLVDGEYKVVAGVRRGMFSPRGDKFTYEMSGLSPEHIRETEREARNLGYN